MEGRSCVVVVLSLSLVPPGRLPIVGCCLEGDDDLGGLEGRSGTSRGGSWNSCCDGVWLLEETWVTVGDTAVRREIR